MKKAIKSTLAVTAGAAVLAGVAAIPALVSAYGDNSANGREEYTQAKINELYAKGEWNKITFNSIIDNKQLGGSEFNFVSAIDEETAKNSGADKVWNADSITVEDGKTYLVRMYVHNNGKSEDDWRTTGKGVSTNTRTFLNIPQQAGKEIKVMGFVNSDNATPTEYWDSVVFKSNNNEAFHLEYVRDSAMIYNQGVASGGIQLSNDVVDKTEGTLIGYDAMDGRVPGCFEYDNIITVRVKAVYDSEYTLQKSVRFAGTTGKNWTDNLDVKIGDELEYQIVYKNTSNVDQYNVMLRDILPNNVEYVPGSTKIWNQGFTGATVDQDDIITEKGINIGNYGPGANAIIRFRAKVVDKNLACGSNTVVNWAHGTVGDTVLQDYANVHLTKVCETPTPTPDPEPTPEPEPTPTPTPDDKFPNDTPTALPTTGPEAVAGAIVGTGSVVTAAGYYVASRRSAKK